MICLTTTTGMANPKSLNAVAVEQVAIVNQKQDVHLEYECCRITYDEIREQLREGAITLEQAQELWLEHKKNEQ